MSSIGGPFIINACRAQMLETALLEINIPGSLDYDCRCRTAQPTLIIQLMIVLTNHGRTDFISVCHVHTCLKRNMTLQRGTHPGGILESNIVKTDVLYRTVYRSFHPYQRFDAGNYGFAYLLSFPRIIIYFTAFNVVIPLAGFIQQFHGIGQIESRVVTILGHHRTRPRVLELDTAFRMMETHGGTVSLYFDRLDTEICHTPHFMKDHFGISGLLYFLYGSGRYPQYFVLGVVVDDAVHLFKVCHIPCTNSLLPIDPQLPEIQRTPVKHRDIGYPQLSLLLPVPDFHPTIQNGISIRSDDGR